MSEHSLLPLRTILDTRGVFSMDDLMRLTGRSKVYIQSRLSAMQNEKWAGKHGPVAFRVLKVNGVQTWQKIN